MLFNLIKNELFITRVSQYLLWRGEDIEIQMKLCACVLVNLNDCWSL